MTLYDLEIEIGNQVRSKKKNLFKEETSTKSIWPSKVDGHEIKIENENR